MRNVVRDVVAGHSSEDLYNQNRGKIATEIKTKLQILYKDRNVVLQDVLLRDVKLPAEVTAAIDKKMAAKQQSEQMQYVLTREKQEAERKTVEAQGIADYQKILSSGLSDKQLQYEMIKAIATSPNAKLIIMGNNKGTPIILDGK